jgi:hypothetical protein
MAWRPWIQPGRGSCSPLDTAPERARLGTTAGARGGARLELARQGGATELKLAHQSSSSWSLRGCAHEDRGRRYNCSTPDVEVSLGKRSFLPNGNSMVSMCVGTREDVVPCRRNDFFNFPSLSSLISMTRHHFANVAPHLMKIEITINVPLGLP